MTVIALASESGAPDRNLTTSETAAANPVCPETMLRLFAVGNQHLRSGAAANPNCDPVLLAVLAADDNPNSATPHRVESQHHADDVGHAHIRCRHPGRWMRVAQPALPRPDTAPSVHQHQHRSTPQRRAEPELSTGSAHLLEQISTEHLAARAAANPNYPPGLLERSAQSPQLAVRSAVAQRRDCPADLLTRPTTDFYWVVRCDVAENPACPHRVVAALSDDPAAANRLSEIFT